MNSEDKLNPTDSMNLWVSERSNDNFSMAFRVNKVLFSQQSQFQRVEIIDTIGYGKMLLNDGLVMISEKDEWIYHEMITHVPLLTHKQPKRVLVVGGGDGGTVREVLKHPYVEKCVLCEIDEVVVEACKKHIPQTASVLTEEKQRLEIKFEDAVSYVKATSEVFDVIIIDSSDPVGPAAPLFNEAFYADCSARLNTGGIIVSQAESPFIYADMQESLCRILKKRFKKLAIYNFTNMTYPNGLWSFTFASNDTSLDPATCFDEKRFFSLCLDCQYYSPAIHRASFCLPPFQKTRLKAYLS